MVQFEREDIKLGPEYPWLVLGDFFEAQIISMVPGKNTKGEDVWKFVLIPTKELAKRYKITMDMLDSDLTINREYPIDMIKVGNSDPAWTRYFCFLNFNGETCPEIMSWASFHDAKKIEGLRQLINLLKAENAYYREALEAAKTNTAKFIKEHIMAPASELNIAQIMQSQNPGTMGFQPGPPVRQQ